MDIRPLNKPAGLLASAPTHTAFDPALGGPLQWLHQAPQPDASLHAQNPTQGPVMWAPGAFPLHVAVTPLPDLAQDKGGPACLLATGLIHAAGGPDALTQAVCHWMMPWQQQSQGLVQFTPQQVQVSSGKQTAQITVHWVLNPMAKAENGVGWVQRKVSGSQPNGVGLLQHVDVYLVLAPVIDQRLSPAQRLKRLQATVLHETGHALGLEHHQSPDAVMHARGWQNTALSAHDLAMLVRLYGGTASPGPFSAMA